MAGKKPNPGTPRDMRLKANKRAAAQQRGAAPSSQPKFGTPAYRAKYGKKN